MTNRHLQELDRRLDAADDWLVMALCALVMGLLPLLLLACGPLPSPALASGSGLVDACGAQAAPFERILVWSEEFAGQALNRRRWRVWQGCGDGTGEPACYVDDGAHAYTQDGALHLLATSDSAGWRSGAIDASPMAGIAAGYLEARVRLPCVDGIAPAWWMLPSAQDSAAWPASGELEIIRLDGAPALTRGAQWGDDWQHIQVDADAAQGASWCATWHVFGLALGARTIAWTVDGQPVHALARDAPFDAPFYPIFELGVDDWTRIDPARAAVEMQVDWVRLWQ